jgi:hypothetical protein
MHPGTTLTDAIRLWPTARAEDGESCGNHPQAQDSLTGATRNWITPSAHDGRRPGSDATSTQGANLKRDAEWWQTPAADSFRSRGGERRDEMGLDQQGRNWITPNARDWKSETGSEHNTYDKTPNLSRQVYRVSHLDPAIPDGPTSSANAPTSRRRLNPRFVEFLLGLPIGWTEL